MQKTLLWILFALVFSAAGFPAITTAQSKPDAAAIADSVILAMGGMENWNRVHYLQWNFFGRRILTWDKWNGDVRIEIPDRKLLLLTNIHTQRGKVFRNGTELTGDSMDYFMNRAYRIWINDAYWLIMPFKLKDPGVQLTLLPDQSDSSGTRCNVLQLTFDQVGVTPQNKYLVWVNPDNWLITQWSYFGSTTDNEPSITTRWDDYQWYGTIRLSGDRGKEGKITGISLPPQLPEHYFIQP